MYTNQSDQKDQKLPVKLVVDESIDFHQVKEIYKVFIECSEQEEKLLDLGTWNICVILKDKSSSNQQINIKVF